MKKLNHIGIFLVCLFITIQSFASEPIRVACIGNSITYGAFIPNREMNCYPAQLQAYLGDGYEVKNFGASGRTILSKGDYPYSETDTYKASLEYQPDIVLIKLGTNDTKPQNWKYKNEFKDNYQTLIDTYRNLKSHPRIILLTPIRCFLPEGSEINAQLIENEVRPTVEELAWKNQLATGEEDKSRGVDSGRALWRLQCVASGRPVGFGYATGQTAPLFYRSRSHGPKDI